MGICLDAYHVQDTSTGRLVAQLPTRLGTCNVMRQNPWNACLALGHPNGVVTMWSPNVGTPLVKMLCHGVRLQPRQQFGFEIFDRQDKPKQHIMYTEMLVDK